MKGNMFLGMGRGSVGDVVFSVVNGQQVARARNRKPANPKSTAQMIQRSRFAYLSKFFSRANQKLFTFAFEDKAKNESDYNAFMRNNVAVTPCATRQMLQNDRNPWFAPFMLSKGSLESLDDDFNVNSGNLELNYTYTVAQPTIGMLSASILEDNKSLRNGDFVTFVLIQSSNSSTAITSLADAKSHDALSYDNEVAPSWRIIQVTIDAESSVTLASIGFCIVQSSGQYKVSIGGNSGEIYGGAVIASRRTPTGLKVSSSHIQLGEEAMAAYNVGMSAEWAEYCAVSLGDTGEAILEGSMSANPQ